MSHTVEITDEDIRYAENIFAVACRQQRHEVIAQLLHIGTALTQRRQVDAQDIQAVVQVEPERAVPHFFEYLAVRCRNDPHIGTNTAA